jgi:hypothetical protein
MADELDEYRISELDTAPSLGANDLMEVAVVDGDAESGYHSYKSPLSLLGDFFNTILQYVTSLKTGNKTVTGAINQTISNFANDYDATATYDVGDCVLYAGVLYKCTTAITTAEAWDATHWTAVKAVDMGGGGALSELTDVAITTPSNGQILQYDSQTDTWKNETLTVVASFSELSDVSLSTLYNNDVPVYNSTTQKWENRTGYIPFKDISGTLSAGETSITLSSGYITTASVVDIYVDDGTNTDPGIQPTSKTVATGSITLTFLPQSVNITVMARISCEVISVGGLQSADYTPTTSEYTTGG